MRLFILDNIHNKIYHPTLDTSSYLVHVLEDNGITNSTYNTYNTGWE